MRVAERHGPGDLALLFTDTLMEDGDLYRFLIEGACAVLGAPRPAPLLEELAAVPEFHVDREGRIAALTAARARAADVLPGLVWIAEGRDPWRVMRDKRMLGNSRIDPCSMVLKRQQTDRWLAANADPADTVCYVGIDWTEIHRYTTLAARWAAKGWRFEAPLCERPYVDKQAMLAHSRALGIEPPRLYALGFAHNNCGAFCIKAGQGHYALLHRVLPDRYAFHEAQEEALRAHLGKNVSILSDRTGDGKKKPLPLRVLRERMEAGAQPDLFDIGGCGCFIDDGDDEPVIPEPVPAATT
jgi:hypothetical protein